MKKTINFMFVLATLFTVAASADQDQEPVSQVDKAKVEATKEQGEQVLGSENNIVDGCTGTDLLEGHGGMDCSSMKVFDFDDRAPLPIPKK